MFRPHHTVRDLLANVDRRFRQSIHGLDHTARAEDAELIVAPPRRTIRVEVVRDDLAQRTVAEPGIDRKLDLQVPLLLVPDRAFRCRNLRELQPGRAANKTDRMDRRLDDTAIDAAVLGTVAAELVRLLREHLSHFAALAFANAILHFHEDRYVHHRQHSPHLASGFLRRPAHLRQIFERCAERFLGEDVTTRCQTGENLLRLLIAPRAAQADEVAVALGEKFVQGKIHCRGGHDSGKRFPVIGDMGVLRHANQLGLLQAFQQPEDLMSVRSNAGDLDPSHAAHSRTVILPVQRFRVSIGWMRKWLMVDSTWLAAHARPQAPRGKFQFRAYVPRKIEQPVMIADKPWESMMIGRHSLLYEGGRYRMWYEARSEEHTSELQ